MGSTRSFAYSRNKSQRVDGDLRTKQKAAGLVEHRLARGRTEAYHDTRSLAIELAPGMLSAPFYPMKVGVVLLPGETFYRSRMANHR